jgi:hypothetical protein
MRAGRRPAREYDTPLGISVGLGSVVAVVAALASAGFPASASGVRLGLFALALAGFAALTVDVTAAAVVTVIGYLVFDGFLVNALGELTWRGAPDVRRFLILVAAAVVGLGVGMLRRWIRQLRRFAPLEAWANASETTAQTPAAATEKELHHV